MESVFAFECSTSKFHFAVSYDLKTANTTITVCPLTCMPLVVKWIMLDQSSSKINRVIFPSRFSNQIKPMALIFKVNMKQNLKKKNVKKKLLCKPYLRQLAQEIGWHYTQQVLSWYLFPKQLITEHQTFSVCHVKVPLLCPDLL